ncbi:hypothetical protein SynROS8604_03257 [Synechococcus sp. ROS8604]|nr:hypothetical protein SynROS8604_03257 [Synechococcus sp. ROS8604]
MLLAPRHRDVDQPAEDRLATLHTAQLTCCTAETAYCSSQQQ